MKRKKFDNVWFALKANEADAFVMTLRSDLMTLIEDAAASWGIPQGEAAKRLGITRPRLNDLLRGKISKFSLDALATLATKAELSVRLSVRKGPANKAA
jgi:predicted XRE-type DNA-binding protein